MRCTRDKTTEQHNMMMRQIGVKDMMLFVSTSASRPQLNYALIYGNHHSIHVVLLAMVSAGDGRKHTILHVCCSRVEVLAPMVVVDVMLFVVERRG
jgi:hypothetical protein